MQRKKPLERLPKSRIKIPDKKTKTIYNAKKDLPQACETGPFLFGDAYGIRTHGCQRERLVS